MSHTATPLSPVLSARSGDLNGIKPPGFSRGMSLLTSHELKEEEPEDLNYLRKTKIICTLGPSTSTVEKISELLRSGMNVARFNFSHGSHESHAEMIAKVRAAIAATGIHCALMLDTKGPEIRTGLLKGGKPIQLKQGQELDILTDAPADFEGDVKAVSVDYKNLPKVVSEGSIVKIDDGLIVCQVIAALPDENKLRVRVTNNAELGQRKGVNLPGAKVDLPDVTEKDKGDIKFAKEQKMDLIAASFMRNGGAVRQIRELLGEDGKMIKIISKIENQEGLDNFDEILEASDSIMVARGDLGVEIPIQKVCTAQKMMIRKCNIAGKPVITATQMLDSMMNNPRPTRAEATDVANAVFDGTDCVMLSGETAKGDYPVDSVLVMAKICRSAELSIDYPTVFQSIVLFTKRPMKRNEAVTSSAVKTALDLHAPAIIVLTESGSSARFVSKYKPAVPIITLTPREETVRSLLLSRAVFPFLHQRGMDETTLRDFGVAIAKKHGWAKAGDDIIIVSGEPEKSGSTNTMRIYTIPS